MAYKVAYCSGETLEHGTGHGFVLMHRNARVKDLAYSLLKERFCWNPFETGGDAFGLPSLRQGWDEPPAIAFYRRLASQDGSPWFVLGRVRPITEAEGRAFFIAEFLLFEQAEVDSLAAAGISPADILLLKNQQLWHQGSRWNQKSRWLDKELDLKAIFEVTEKEPSPTTGAGHAPFPPQDCCWLANRRNTDPGSLVEQYRDALHLLAQSQNHPPLLWSVPFTNFALRDDAEDSRLWLGCWRGVPAHESIWQNLQQGNLLDLDADKKIIASDLDQVSRLQHAAHFWLPSLAEHQVDANTTLAGEEQGQQAGTASLANSTLQVEATLLKAEAGSAQPPKASPKRSTRGEDQSKPKSGLALFPTPKRAGFAALIVLLIVGGIWGASALKKQMRASEETRLENAHKGRLEKHEKHLTQLMTDGNYDGFTEWIKVQLESTEDKNMLAESDLLRDYKQIRDALPKLRGMLDPTGADSTSANNPWPHINDKGFKAIMAAVDQWDAARKSLSKILKPEKGKTADLATVNKHLDALIAPMKALPSDFRLIAAPRLMYCLESALNLALESKLPSPIPKDKVEKAKDTQEQRGQLLATVKKGMETLPKDFRSLADQKTKLNELYARADAHQSAEQKLLASASPVEGTPTPTPEVKTPPSGPALQIFFADNTTRAFPTGTLLSKPGTMIVGETLSSFPIARPKDGGLVLDWTDASKLITTSYAENPKRFYRDKNQEQLLKGVEATEGLVKDLPPPEPSFPWLLIKTNDGTEAALLCPIAECPKSELRLRVDAEIEKAGLMRFMERGFIFSVEVEFKDSSAKSRRMELTKFGDYPTVRETIINEKMEELQGKAATAAGNAMEAKKADDETMAAQKKVKIDGLNEALNKENAEVKKLENAVKSFGELWLKLNLLKDVHILTAQKTNYPPPPAPKKPKKGEPADPPPTPHPTFTAKKEDANITQSKEPNVPGEAAQLKSYAKITTDFSAYLSSPASQSTDPSLGNALQRYWSQVASRVVKASYSSPLGGANRKQDEPLPFLFLLGRNALASLTAFSTDIGKTTKNYTGLRTTIQPHLATSPNTGLLPTDFPTGEYKWDEGNAQRLFKHWKELIQGMEVILPFLEWEANQKILTDDQKSHIQKDGDFARKWFELRKQQYLETVVASAKKKAADASKAVEVAEKPASDAGKDPGNKKAGKNGNKNPEPTSPKADDIVKQVWLVIKKADPSK